MLRRGLGALLLVLVLTPVHRLLAPGRIGPFGEAARSLGDANLAFGWWGVALTLGAGFVLATLLPSATVRRWLRRIAKGLTLQALPVWAAVLAMLATLLALAASQLLFQGLPTGVDEMASLLQARYMAAGMVAGPRPAEPGAFLILNTVLTPAGWASLYAPTHLLLLAGGLTLGAAWLVGPLLTGLTAGASAVALELCLPPERRAEARLAGLLVAVSPFLLFLGGGYWSHASAAAFTALTLAAALLARDRGWGWAVAAGAGVGLLVTSRPWTGLALGTAFTAGLWGWSWLRGGRPMGWLAARAAAVVAGGAPFAAAWLAYNRHLFGSPFRLGYTWAYGPAHGLGFHQDPWGNLYGVREAVGYTSANLIALGVNLLETPLPAVILVGVWLIWSRRQPSGTGVLLLWACAPLVANFFYWHHGFHMGPRMLYEAAPAWLGLSVLAAVALAQVPSEAEKGTDSPPDAPPPRRLPKPGDVALWGFLFALALAPALALQRGWSYRHTPEELARFQAPAVPFDSRPALVFVHGSWTERMGARLRGDGMTLDSLETALRRNDACSVQAYASARVEEGVSELPALDFEVVAGYPEHLVEVWLSPGNRVLADPTRSPSARCRLEAFADRNGVVSLAPLSWQGDLPGIAGEEVMFVRDLGPAGNRDVLDGHPGRTPFFLFTPDTLSAPVLRPYAEGLWEVWGLSPPTGP